MAREVEYVKKLGVRVITDYVVGKTRSIDELLDKYDAIFIGTGAGLPWFMNIPGENLNGVYSANEYLTRMNLMQGYRYPRHQGRQSRRQKVAVVGGGNAWRWIRHGQLFVWVRKNQGSYTDAHTLSCLPALKRPRMRKKKE